MSIIIYMTIIQLLLLRYIVKSLNCCKLALVPFLAFCKNSESSPRMRGIDRTQFLFQTLFPGGRTLFYANSLRTYCFVLQIVVGPPTLSL